MTNWRASWNPARLEEVLPDGRVRCHLSPRNCVIREGQHGFCGVRANRGGRLVTLNYGKSVHLTQETIETEAVNHFAPGEPILSLGNIGCMLNCSYCHNWKTSQAKYVEDADVRYYTPETVVETAIRRGIRVLSWTYNDPVVWHEFVRDTSRLAHEAGLLNLFKSAFFITPEAIDELLPVIDIFSISIKSIDPEYYRRYTTGWLEPVLEGAKQVHRAGKHLEVSTLMITDVSDDTETARRVANWVLDELGPRVPVHFVRFHPDYKMRETIRTPVDRLVRAREIARAAGLKHVYLGNVFDTPWTDTRCDNCDALLVHRYGLHADALGLTESGRCAACGTDADIVRLPPRDVPVTHAAAPDHDCTRHVFAWHGDVRCLHVQLQNPTDHASEVHVRQRLASGHGEWTVMPLGAGESYRFAVAKRRSDDEGCEVAAPAGVATSLHEVFDRAHFPTTAIESVVAPTDASPLPYFPGRQVIRLTATSP